MRYLTDSCATLSESDVAVGDHWCPSERVDRREFGRCQVLRGTLILFNFIRDLKFFLDYAIVCSSY